MCFEQEILQQFREDKDLWGFSMTAKDFQQGERERLRIGGNEGEHFRHQSVNKGIMVEKYKGFGRRLILKPHEEKGMPVVQELLDIKF